MTTLAPTDARWALAAAVRLGSAPLPGLLDVLSELIAAALPSAGAPMVAVLTGDCSRSPLKLAGPEPFASRVTSAELARLGAELPVGEPTNTTVSLGGEPRRALVYAAKPPGAAGSIFAITLAGDDEPPTDVVAVVGGLCEVAATAWIDHAVAAPVEPLPSSLIAAQERTRAITELTEAHEATLTAVLAALRSRDLADDASRVAATDLAVAALIELREAGDRGRSLAEEPAGAAFERLQAQLAPIARYASATLELVGPAEVAATTAAGGASAGGASGSGRGGADRPLPAELAHAARATARGIALVLLEQEGVSRIRVAWQVEPGALAIVARDDGPGALRAEALAVHRIAERVEALGGSVTVDAVEGWGTTVRAELPLGAGAAPADDGPLRLLGARELEVLTELARGSRNAQIAEALTITPHTVKFHVANILRKLGVDSRGEAAAIAHQHGLGS